MSDTFPSIAVPSAPTLDGLEVKWSQQWDEQGVFRFDRSRPRAEVYSIDTPPPTVSGSLHVGHVFSYTHTDAVARYQRMCGREVFYPMGWDDNGLATERRVQNYYGVRCDPALPYDPDFTPPAKPGKTEIPVSRQNFIELCERLTVADEQAFEAVWRRLGLSVDWQMTYQTISDRSRKISQLAFIRNVQRGEAYRSDGPTLWDTTYETAVAQAELEDRERPAAYHRIAFHRPDGGRALVATTRPELLPACVALVAHPDDERYRELVGTTVRTPVFGVEVPVRAHRLADPEKGTGLVMVCTFGDLTDVLWWRELQLPTRPVIGPNGRIVADPPPGLDDPEGQKAYAQLAGGSVSAAQQRVVELLQAAGDLEGEPEPITHPVKFYERGTKPLEIIPTQQWYVRNGGRDLDLRSALIGRGQELTWHPAYMRGRYESWVNGLTGDWLISRQRFFGVPVPVWYPLDAHGEPVDEPILPDEAALPVDPSVDVPPGYRADQRGEPGGFVGDADVMDTWATSSLTPLIAGGWSVDDDLFGRVFPMDLRPQAHDIIRTWLFATVVRTHLEFDSLPWSNAALSGWVLDPDRKKMSKSKGNVVTPMGLLEQYGSDAVRYWAASGRPGTDTAFDTGQMKVGRRLAVKVLNASRFVLGLGLPSSAGSASAGSSAPGVSAVTDSLDRAMLAELAGLVEEATAAFEEYEYTRALERTEHFFWRFCGDYLELVKSRAYGERGEAAADSARAALTTALDVLLRLFAPFLPFVTEEVWSWWREGSVHRAAWPTPAELWALSSGGSAGVAEPSAAPSALAVAGDVIMAIRKAKSEAKVSMRTETAAVVVRADEPTLAVFRQVADDVRAAGRVITLDTRRETGSELAVDVTLESP